MKPAPIKSALRIGGSSSRTGAAGAADGYPNGAAAGSWGGEDDTERGWGGEGYEDDGADGYNAGEHLICRWEAQTVNTTQQLCWPENLDDAVVIECVRYGQKQLCYRIVAAAGLAQPVARVAPATISSPLPFTANKPAQHLCRTQ